ncbi:MAG: RNA polymerase sigma-70 factor [Bacteroidales bacterium]
MNYTPLFLNKIKRRDEYAFQQLYEEMYTSLVLFAQKYLKDKSLSQDLVQEVFAKLWTDAQKINISDSIKSYLYTTTRNMAINAIEKRETEKKYLDIFMHRQECSVDEYNMMAQDAYGYIYKAINDLPKKPRDVIMMSLKDLSCLEIQEELCVSKNTVKTHKARAYKSLRAKLKGQF